jgi:hypothetical protein
MQDQAAALGIRGGGEADDIDRLQPSQGLQQAPDAPLGEGAFEHTGPRQCGCLQYLHRVRFDAPTCISGLSQALMHVAIPPARA